MKSHQIYELLVTATDHGKPHSLESTVILRIEIEEPIEELNANGLILNVLWLTEDATAQFPENLIIGYVLARISIDGHTETKSLSLVGSNSLCLKQTDSLRVYLLIVCGPLDREIQSFYRLNLILRNINDEVLIDHPLHVDLIDRNDNAPQWNQSSYRILWNWHRFEDNVQNNIKNNVRLLAKDLDIKENGKIRYSIQDTSYFTINSELGILSMVDDVSVNFAFLFNTLKFFMLQPELNFLYDFKQFRRFKFIFLVKYNL